MFGGIDLGGTKIEACLFDPELTEIARRRVPTPRQSFDELLDALVAQYEWLRAEAGTIALPVGVGIPGLIERSTGLSLTSNLPATNRPLHDALSRRLGFSVPVDNDCKCFALSEANGGAGEGYDTVFGLILGTGCGGGVCHKGRLVQGHNGLPGEVGHFGIAMNAAPQVTLPLRHCNCGRYGCYETLVSGPGLTALAKSLKGLELSPEQIASGAAAGDGDLAEILAIWADIVGELLRTIQGTVDPDCVVLGGGLSRIEGVAELLLGRMPGHFIAGMRAPAILVARYGDSSGVRGAAMLAARQQPDRSKWPRKASPNGANKK
jgi:predicted NBD/HSP70 family sugar kinase